MCLQLNKTLLNCVLKTRILKEFSKEYIRKLTFFYINRRKFCIVQIFEFWFLKNLHILGCPDHDLTIYGICLSVCLDVWTCICMWQKFCDRSSLTTNAQNFMKLYILNFITINWCLLTFEENRSTGGVVITLFLEFSR